MNRLTLEERRRVYLAQRRAQERVLVRPQPETIEAFAPRSDPRRLRWIAVAAMIAAALGVGSSPRRRWSSTRWNRSWGPSCRGCNTGTR